MNINDFADDLIKEEQYVLDQLISKMNREIQNLDTEMRQYVKEAKNADISIHLDLYLSKLLAEKGIRDTKENREKVLQARDELYKMRILLGYEDDYSDGIVEVKVGLHTCVIDGIPVVVSWKQPFCRHYIMDNPSEEYINIEKGKHGEEFRTKYKLIARDMVDLWFTRVKKVTNRYPGFVDIDILNNLKSEGFWRGSFIDKLIDMFNPDDFDPDGLAKMIYDEFLEELMERRTSSEFKNIVFSIQKKQGEIIQSPYTENMVVQGCAGSGKSMIMLHRLPILLYDNPDRFSRTSLYIITPSQMYIQLADNMRHQLEISDVNMGTIEQYFDYCIDKYPGHKAGEYGKISYKRKLSLESERYIYSSECIDDIKKYMNQMLKDTDVSLDEVYDILGLEKTTISEKAVYNQKVRERFVRIQNVLTKNSQILLKYFKTIRDILDALSRLSEIIELSVRRGNSAEYIESIGVLKKDIEAITKEFPDLQRDFYEIDLKDIYDAINKAGTLIGGIYVLSWNLSRIQVKNNEKDESVIEAVNKATGYVAELQKINDKYLDYELYESINNVGIRLSEVSSEGIQKTYEYVMGKIGININEKGSIKAIKWSPYIYLQILYMFQGVAPANKETLLAIDEAQGISVEEIRLIKNINGNDVILNIFGDIYQHIEGTKGIDDWSEYKNVIDFDSYELQENYRNASQITEYCNRIFGMKMEAINTPGKGVHELNDEEQFRSTMIKQLIGSQRVGLAAIIVGEDSEARYLLGEFSDYSDKFHDMTGEDFSINNSKWNIININDAKGLEFGTVIVLSGRMSRNQKYISYTRALDDLYIYDKTIDVKGYERKARKKDEEQSPLEEDISRHVVETNSKDFSNSQVRKFFEERGLEVIDNRKNGGRLWVIGEKNSIRDIVNEAITKFKISGKYASSNESNNKPGWCTKTEK